MKVSLIDIQKAIVDKLKLLDIKIYAEEIKEGFTTPCFFLTIEKFENSLENSNIEKRYLDVYIRYIKEGITTCEKLEMIEKLEDLFLKNIKVKDRFFIIHNKLFVKNRDDFLELNFGIEYYSIIKDEENNEIIENIELEF